MKETRLKRQTKQSDNYVYEFLPEVRLETMKGLEGD